ncbi:hypothetical protein E1N52_11055 [Paraburkholderia guartelaensis]|uniref:Uncharacterized protein n=1 Tax=Paraburkholderia guartelaensis TaxID=2546446 RepID=A0A4R5LGU5_9BURK|nr:hypothetical protein [Paraburkholderia guartelaensis]TDG08455.1 hypothetical protein E1N52_11055 [Paraburkholderia guartelaensis]
MKFTTLACALLALFWLSLRVQAQIQPQPEDYAYLRRIRVPDAVVNCVAALDQWVHKAQRYDSLLVPDRRALSAKIEQPVPVNATPLPAASDALTPVPSIDTLIHLHAFAKVRGKYAWVPVKATCGIWHSHVVDVALSPRGTHATSPIH